jgi:hypothetical protein
VFYLVRALFLSWVEWVRQGVVFNSSAAAAGRLLARYLAADYLLPRQAPLGRAVSR